MSAAGWRRWRDSHPVDPPAEDRLPALAHPHGASADVLPVHAKDERGNRMYLAMRGNAWGHAAPFTRVYLEDHLVRAFAAFRLSVVRVAYMTGRWTQPPTHLLDRVCQFCLSNRARRIVEDPYHVCMECPLYDTLRKELFVKLHRDGFCFPLRCDLWQVYRNRLAGCAYA